MRIINEIMKDVIALQGGASRETLWITPASLRHILELHLVPHEHVAGAESAAGRADALRAEAARLEPEDWEGPDETDAGEAYDFEKRLAIARWLRKRADELEQASGG